ncbi:MAG: RluA family pseudouridine synthase, partial [Betaproteobacteria bacterium]|nr:RluA family pseudouridine synthase [Betaproteobacteria bacterium]
MKDLNNVSAVLVTEEEAGQRIDNYLLRVCKGVPRSHIYRILRSGEVRVNSRRVAATYRLREADRMRIPPIRLAAVSQAQIQARTRPMEFPVAFQDDAILVIDKPAGVAVHGGSGISNGIIESLRASRPEVRFLELVHRLDRDTSGLLLLAKKRSALAELHEQMRSGAVFKRYIALVLGAWEGGARVVSLPLRKYLNPTGERRVSVDRLEGSEAVTEFAPERKFEGFTLLSARLRTGRTHQIRVHLAHLGFPIAGDEKYGIFERNRILAKQGLRRMFLHAAELRFRHPVGGETVAFERPLPVDLKRFLETL